MTVWKTHADFAMRRYPWDKEMCLGNLVVVEWDEPYAILECDQCGYEVAVKKVRELDSEARF